MLPFVQKKNPQKFPLFAFIIRRNIKLKKYYVLFLSHLPYHFPSLFWNNRGLHRQCTQNGGIRASWPLVLIHLHFSCFSSRQSGIPMMRPVHLSEYRHWKGQFARKPLCPFGTCSLFCQLMWRRRREQLTWKRWSSVAWRVYSRSSRSYWRIAELTKPRTARWTFKFGLCILKTALDLATLILISASLFAARHG